MSDEQTENFIFLDKNTWTFAVEKK